MAKKKQTAYNLTGRYWFIASVLFVLACLLVGNIAHQQFKLVGKKGVHLGEEAKKISVKTVSIPAVRGIIQDRNGEPLAVSTPMYRLVLNPYNINAHEKRMQKNNPSYKQSYKQLARIIGVSESLINKKINKDRSNKHLLIKRKLLPAQKTRIDALELAGIEYEQYYKRYYPAGEVAAHLVGFTDSDENGLSGLEKTYNQQLNGEDGEKKVVTSKKSKHISRSIEGDKNVQHGENIKLSIDLRLQYLAYRELKAGIRNAKAASGSVVILDVKTGEVLAMVNQPSFNPNNRRKINFDHLRNRAITDQLEPASTIKTFTMIAALESGKYKPESTVDTGAGYMKVGKKIVADPRAYGELDLGTILAKSSQVATSKIALSLEDDAVYDVLARFGFGQYPGTGFPGEGAGLLRDHSRWNDIAKITLAYGYGLAVTPLQIANAYAGIANQGIKMPVSLLKLEKSPEGDRVLAKSVSSDVLDMLKQVATEGSARSAQIPHYSVAGKTGTAHKVSSKGGYAEARYTSLFAGVAPATDPRFVAVVVINDPRSNKYYGGEVAAPVFSKVADKALRMLNVAPDIFPEQQNVVGGF